jgi:hypothetical protein
MQIQSSMPKNSRCATLADSVEFLNRHSFCRSLKTASLVTPPLVNRMPGWNGIVSLSGQDHSGHSYDIDFPHAWAPEIFRQNYIDWIDSRLDFKPHPAKESARSKLIIYLCEPGTGLDEAAKPPPLLINMGWSEIDHVYLRLLLARPFESLLSKETARFCNDWCAWYSQCSTWMSREATGLRSNMPILF